jgi:hypothetical protein
MASNLPQDIEIFKPGRHTDDMGTVHNFSAADVAGMVASYEPKLREAPLTVGHPAHNLPAYGWVEGLAVNASGGVSMKTHQVQPQFAEMVDKKLFKKRSASFYPPSHPNNPKPGNWYLRHVAFLGAQPPAIAGLADFASDPTGSVSFSEGVDEPVQALPTPVPPVPPVNSTNPAFNQEQLQMTKELQDQLAAAQAKNTELAATAAKATADAAAAQAQLAQFSEAARTERTAGFTSYAEAQVKAAVVKPNEKAAVVDLLNLAADAKPVSFAEGTGTRTVAAVDFVKSLIERAKPAVSFGEQAAGSLGSAGSAVGLSEVEIVAKARAYALQHKVNYAEALTAVCTFSAAA